MKKLAMLLSLVFVAGVVTADDAKKPEVKPAEAKSEKAAKMAEKLGKTHDVDAEVVSVDTAKGTLTIKAEGGDKTVPVDTKATSSLKDLKAGDKVKLTCWDDEKGDHKKVVAIAKL
jgi:hypothetical protein